MKVRFTPDAEKQADESDASDAITSSARGRTWRWTLQRISVRL
jgi:hypothetical protein